jgi:hypothetical protein
MSFSSRPMLFGQLIDPTFLQFDPILVSVRKRTKRSSNFLRLPQFAQSFGIKNRCTQSLVSGELRSCNQVRRNEFGAGVGRRKPFPDFGGE